MEIKVQNNRAYIERLRNGNIEKRFGKVCVCEECNKLFFATTDQIKKDYGKFCSHRCAKLGKRNPNWQGGLTSINQRIRCCSEYKKWKKSVLERDSYACQLCCSEEDLQVDYIKSFAFYPELRFDVNNGRTLCVVCHKETDTYLNRWA